MIFTKFTEKDVEFWRGKAETRFQNYTPGNGTVSTRNTKPNRKTYR